MYPPHMGQGYSLDKRGGYGRGMGGGRGMGASRDAVAYPNYPYMQLQTPDSTDKVQETEALRQQLEKLENQLNKMRERLEKLR